MTIEIGQSLPDIEISVIDQGTDMQRLGTATLFAEKNVVMFAVPGAFTPTCSERHLPGYVTYFEQFKNRGIEVFCMAVNDAFVMQAWADSQRVPAGLKLLADGNGLFTQSLGLEMDGNAYGMGVRSRRFALYAKDGVVKQLYLEHPGELRVTNAEAMLAAIAE